MNQQNEQNDIVEKWDEFCKMEEENSKETERMVTKKRKMMDEIKNGMTKKDEEIGKLRKENRALKLKMAKMEADLKAQNVSIRRQMPSELSNEMFASMPFGNAFGLLAKMPNGLLARNVLKMINGIKKAVKNNKLDEGNCGTKLIISEDGLETKHLGPAADEWNCVRAIFPITTLNLSIKKPTIAYYYEVQILNLTYCYAIAIGFCDQQFPLEDKWLGMVDNSIGFGYKWGIWIDRNEIRFRNSGFFRKGDFIGIGIIQHPKGKMECFATWNGKLLGKTNLPSKFANLQIYPAIGLRNPDDTVRANFKKEEWKFKHFQSLLE